MIEARSSAALQARLIVEIFLRGFWEPQKKLRQQFSESRRAFADA
jgi:hypothetical protein